MIKNIRGIKYCGKDDCDDVDKMGEAFGGGIYGASCSIGFSNSPTKITLNVISEDGQYTIDKDTDLNVTDTGPVSLQIGGKQITDPATGIATTDPGTAVTFNRMYIYSFSKSSSPGSKNLTVNLVDHSIMLDKIFVGLIGRHGTRAIEDTGESAAYNPANDVQISPRTLTYGFRIVCTECNEMSARQLTTPPTWKPPHYIQRLSYMAGSGNKCAPGAAGGVGQPLKTYINVEPGAKSINGGYILLGQEGFKETECEIAKITYTFEDLCNALDWILGGDPENCKGGGAIFMHNLRDFNRSTTYEANYTGTLREVLSSWAADFSFDFTFMYESPNCDDTDPTDIPGFNCGIRIHGIDLKEPIDLIEVRNAIEDGFGPDSDGGLIRSHTENVTLENTYYQTPLVKYIKPARPFQRQKIHYEPIIGKILTPMDAIGTSAHGARTDDEFYASMALAKYSPEARLIWLSDLARLKNEDPHWCNYYHHKGQVVIWNSMWAGEQAVTPVIPAGTGHTHNSFVTLLGYRHFDGTMDISEAELLAIAGVKFGLNKSYDGGCDPDSRKCFNADCLDADVATNAPTSSPCDCPKVGAKDSLFNPFKHGRCSDPNYHTLFDCLTPKAGKKPKNRWTPSANSPKLRRDGIWPSLGFFPVISFNKFIEKDMEVPSDGYEWIGSGSTAKPAPLKPGVSPYPNNSAKGVAGASGTDIGLRPLWNPDYLEKDGSPKKMYLNPPVDRGAPWANPLASSLKHSLYPNAPEGGECRKGPAGTPVNASTYKNQNDCGNAGGVWWEYFSECKREGTCYHYHMYNREAADHLNARQKIADRYELCKAQAHPVWCDAEKFSVYLGIWNEAQQEAIGDFDRELANDFLGKYGYWWANRSSAEEVEVGIFDEGPANPPPNERDCPKYHFDLEGGQEHATYIYEYKVSTLPESKIYSGHSYPFQRMLRANGDLFGIPNVYDPALGGNCCCCPPGVPCVFNVDESNTDAERANAKTFCLNANGTWVGKRYKDTEPYCTFCPERSIFEIEDNAWGTPPNQITEMLKNKFIIDMDDAPPFTKDPNVLSDLNLYTPRYKRLNPFTDGAYFKNIVGLQNWRQTILKPEFMKDGYFPAIAVIPHMDAMVLDIVQPNGIDTKPMKILDVNFDHWTCTNAQVYGQENKDGTKAGTCSDPNLYTQASCIAAGACSDRRHLTQAACQADGDFWHANTWAGDPAFAPQWDHWCHTGICTTTTAPSPTTTTAGAYLACWTCLSVANLPVGYVYAASEDEAKLYCAQLSLAFDSVQPCVTTTTAAPAPRVAAEESTFSHPNPGYTPPPTCPPYGVGLPNESSQVFSPLVYRNYERRRKESLIGAPSECVLYCEEDIKSEVCACPEIEEPIHGFSNYAVKYLQIKHVEATAKILFPIEHEYTGFWVSEQSHRGTTMKKQVVMGEPPKPSQLKEKNVMATRIIDIDATSELDALESTTPGHFEEKIVVTNNHVDPPRPEVVTLPQYYSFILGLEQSADQAGEQIDVRLDGTEFDTFREKPDGTIVNLLSPAYGLNTFNITLDAGGISTNLSFRSRPKKLPKRDVLLQKIGPRAIDGKLPHTIRTNKRGWSI